MSISEKSETRYTAAVNLECPDELHELHNDNPFAPHKHAVFSYMLSKYLTKLRTNME